MTRDLSILIPARNEMFLKHTVEDILKNIEGNTEIIIVLDGELPIEPIADHERVTLIHYPESIGQRAAQNIAAKLSRAKYIMKVDAHCAFDKGFDVKMLEGIKGRDDWTMVPNMKNLHVFDWVCEDGHRRYQGPEGACQECGKPTKRDVVWFAKKSPNSTTYLFNDQLQFKYFGQWKARQFDRIAETLSLQGSCFMCTRKKYWELNLCDESWGSWGQQGSEVALKTWLSGGQVVCNRNTWYAHLFRTQKGFRWPYPAPGRSQRDARRICREIFLNDKWEQAIYPIKWLVQKFAPVPFWDDIKPLSKAMIYYTDNQLSLKIARPVQKNLKQISKQKDIPLISSSLKPMSDMGENIHVDSERGYLTMFKQILACLEATDAEVVYFCEHDVLYHHSHFDFIPAKRDVFYYNINVWKVREEDGHALKVDVCRQVSGLVGFREELIKHYKERIKKVEKKGRFERNMGFEPGTHGRVPWEHKYTSQNFMSTYPNVDIRHSGNLTANRWSKDQFRNQKWTKGWTESKVIPGWGKFKEFFRK